MTNDVSKAHRSRYRSDPWKVLDYLPPDVRRALHEATVDWDPRWALTEMWRRIRAGETQLGAAAGVARHIEECDEWELARFAKRGWPKACGPYPHIAAGASPVRYNSAQRP